MNFSLNAYSVLIEISYRLKFLFWRGFRRVDTFGQAGETLGEKQFFLFNALGWVGDGVCGLGLVAGQQAAIIIS
jgi:hypothetical protein